MNCCTLCGEKKLKEEFKNVMYFTQYKKQKVNWCRECQKMYIEYKRGIEAKNKFENLKGDYKVSFE